MINAHTSFVIVNARYLEKDRAFTFTIVTPSAVIKFSSLKT